MKKAVTQVLPGWRPWWSKLARRHPEGDSSRPRTRRLDTKEPWLGMTANWNSTDPMRLKP